MPAPSRTPPLAMPQYVWSSRANPLSTMSWSDILVDAAIGIAWVALCAWAAWMVISL